MLAGPLAQVEYAYWSGRLPLIQRESRAAQWLIGLVLAALLIISGLLLYLLAVDPIGLRYDPANQLDMLTNSVTLLALLVLSIHFLTLVVTLGTARLGPTRRTSAAWSLLLISGVSARTLILSRWVALVRVLWPRFALLAIIRAALTIPLSLLTINLPGRLLYTSGFQPTTVDVYPLQMLLGVLLVMVFTGCNLLLTTAAATAHASWHRRTRDGIESAFVSRFAAILPMLVVIIALIAWLSSSQQDQAGTSMIDSFSTGGGRTIETLSLAAVSLVDNGTWVAITTAYPYRTMTASSLMGAGLAALLYLLMTAYLLAFATFRTYRQGAAAATWQAVRKPSESSA